MRCARFRFPLLCWRRRQGRTTTTSNMKNQNTTSYRGKARPSRPPSLRAWNVKREGGEKWERDDWSLWVLFAFILYFSRWRQAKTRTTATTLMMWPRPRGGRFCARVFGARFALSLIEWGCLLSVIMFHFCLVRVWVVSYRVRTVRHQHQQQQYSDMRI